METSIFTPLAREMKKVLREMGRSDLATPPAPRKGGGPMDQYLNVHYNYHKVIGRHLDDCYMIRWDIEALI